MIRQSLLLLTIVIVGIDVHSCSHTFPSKLLLLRTVHRWGESTIASIGFNRGSPSMTNRCYWSGYAIHALHRFYKVNDHHITKH